MKTMLARLVAVVLACALACIAAGCAGQGLLPVSPDVIRLETTMNTDDDVYVLEMDVYAGDEDFWGSGTADAAQRAPLSRGEVVVNEIERSKMPQGLDSDDLSVAFYVRDDFAHVGDVEVLRTHDGAYEVSPRVDIPSAWGESVAIEITGDRASGYVARLMTEATE